MIHVINRARFDGLMQAGHDLISLAKIQVHQFAEENGVAIAGGSKLVEIDQRGGIGWQIGGTQWGWYSRT
jgi:hypothetical protein